MIAYTKRHRGRAAQRFRAGGVLEASALRRITRHLQRKAGAPRRRLVGATTSGNRDKNQSGAFLALFGIMNKFVPTSRAGNP